MIFLRCFSAFKLAMFFHRTLYFIIQHRRDKVKATALYVQQRLASFGLFLVDYLSIVLPMIVCFTLTQYTWLVYIVMLGLSLVWMVNTTSLRSGEPLHHLNSNKKPFLNAYRSSMMLMTCIAILAVDFRIFPRKFAKTETYGISLMDIGVGSFIISSALVSPKARESISHNTRLDKDIKHAQNRHLSQDHKGTSRISALLSTLRSIALLLFIGVSRFVVVKALNYQEHVTEYGVHWNFFLTLALVALFVAVLDISARWSGVVGTLLLCAYQIALSYFGIAEYIVNAERTNFFSQNREGILSLVGYVALFLISTQIGYYLMRPKTYREWWFCVYELLLGAVLCWLGAHISEDFFHLYSSRRMVNVPYVLHVLSVNLVVLALCLIVDLLTPPNDNCDNLMTRIAGQRNAQLVVFLWANILTGVINLAMRTLYATATVAFVVINCYMVAVCFITYIDIMSVLSRLRSRK
jgi:phosphatidylinositol glycan class W